MGLLFKNGLSSVTPFMPTLTFTVTLHCVGDCHIICTVSYTHLDVYKRQVQVTTTNADKQAITIDRNCNATTQQEMTTAVLGKYCSSFPCKGTLKPVFRPAK